MSVMTAHLPRLLKRRARPAPRIVTFTPLPGALTATRPQPALREDGNVLERVLNGLQKPPAASPRGMHPFDAPLRTETEKLLGALPPPRYQSSATAQALTGLTPYPRRTPAEDGRELPLLRTVARALGWGSVLHRGNDPLPRRRWIAPPAEWDAAMERITEQATAAIAANHPAPRFNPARAAESAAAFLCRSRNLPLPAGRSRDIIAAEYRLDEAITAYRELRAFSPVPGDDREVALESAAREADEAANALYDMIADRLGDDVAAGRGHAA